MTRLDSELVRRGICPSRERAKEYIRSGQVYVNSFQAIKPAAEVSESDIIELRGETLKYAGRGGLKLEHALKAFKIDVSGYTCLDIGASTGGFTDCLLQSGAKKVYAVDVGHDQLAEKLRNDPRVVNMEGVNVKDFTASMLPKPIDFACSDLSFISAIHAANALKDILPEGRSAVILIKPQFEAGRENLSKTGVVRDKKVHVKVLKDITQRISALGFEIKDLCPSPIRGGDGNIEYLLHAVKQYDFTPSDINFSDIVTKAFEKVKQ